MNSIEELPDDYHRRVPSGQRRLLRLKKSRLSRLFFYASTRHEEDGIQYINPLNLRSHTMSSISSFKANHIK